MKHTCKGPKKNMEKGGRKKEKRKGLREAGNRSGRRRAGRSKSDSTLAIPKAFPFGDRGR